MITIFLNILDNSKLYNIKINKYEKIKKIKLYIANKLNIINYNDIKLYYNNRYLNSENYINNYNINNNNTINIKLGNLKGGTIKEGVYSNKINNSFNKTVTIIPIILMLIFITFFVPIYFIILMIIPNYSYSYCCKLEEQSSFSNLGIILNFYKEVVSGIDKRCKEIKCKPDNYFELIINRISTNNFSIFDFFKSPVYWIYAIMLIGFIILFSILQSLTSYIESFGKINKDKKFGKCYLINDTKNIKLIGLLTLFILPLILIYISAMQTKYSILIAFIFIAISFICIMTVVYPLEKQRDGVLINYMRKIYYSPIIGILTYFVFYFLFFYIDYINISKCPISNPLKNNILNIIYKFIILILCGVAATVTSIIPLYYILRYEIPRYCLYFPDCNKLTDEEAFKIKKENNLVFAHDLKEEFKYE